MVPSVMFYFVRHGVTDWNARNITMGRQDVSLNATGIQQAHAAAQLLQKIPVKMIYHSPLLRAVQTAEIISHSVHASLSVASEFSECYLGVHEGKSSVETTWKQAWYNGTLKNAETHYDFSQRVLRGLQKVLIYEHEPLLIVAHAGVYSMIQELLQLPLLPIDHCTIYQYMPPTETINTWSVREI